MNPLPLVQVQAGPPAGDSSLSSQNDDDENRSVNSARFSNHSQSDPYMPNPESLYMTNIANEQYHQEQHGISTPTPRHSNRARTHSNSEAVSNATMTRTAPMGDLNTTAKELTIRVTTRPIMSWSPQVEHADGTSHTMTIDLPPEFSGNTGTIVITQQGWQRMYHIIATAVAKNTSESILSYWISGCLLIIMALIMLSGRVKGISARFSLLLIVLGVTSLMGIAHAVVRRIRVHMALRQCVEECFYDAEAEAMATIVAANAAAGSMHTDVEQAPDDNAANDLDMRMGGALDGLQELEDVANVDGAAADTNHTFGSALRQRLNSHSSSHNSITNSSNNVIGNRQRLDTGGGNSTVSSSSNMMYEEEGPRRNRAVSRDGMYCVNWKWEFLGMDAVVKISWE